MRNVLIDGVSYAPVCQSNNGTIGIAITTHNRLNDIEQAITHQLEHLPKECDRLVIVCDGDETYNQLINSKTINTDNQLLHIMKSHGTGVANAKNTCIEQLMQSTEDPLKPSHIQHLFLFDDDCWPKADGWEKPYIKSPEPHLSHSFNLTEIYRDKHIVATHAVGGTMLYYERQVIEQVGGMRLDFGTWGCEHVNLSDRIFNRDLTTWRYADIPEAYDGKLFEELDRSESKATNPKHKSSATSQQLEHNRREGRALWKQRIKTDKATIPYRTQHNIVFTTLFTNAIDPQRGRITGLTARSIKPLAQTLDPSIQLIVFTDNPNLNDTLKTLNPNTRVIITQPVIRLDYQRWQLITDYLQTHPLIDYAWAVDATDVTMVNNPFPHMQPNTLYIGDEPETYESDWLHKQGDDPDFHTFINNHPQQQLLNCGLAGADHKTLLTFTRRIIHMWNDNQIDNTQKWKTGSLGTDMAAANQTAITGSEQSDWTLSHGPHINQIFRTSIGNKHAWWTHKDPEHTRIN